MTINPLNESPALVIGSVVNVAEGGSLVIDQSHLDSDDPDDTGLGLIYQVTSLPVNGILDDVDGDAFSAVRIINMTANGILLLSGNEVTTYTEIGAADLSAGNLVYRPAFHINDSVESNLFAKAGFRSAF